MKLTLQHLAAYLPYGLKGIDIAFGEPDSNVVTLIGLADDSILTEDDELPFSAFKPLLRPLSDLTTEIEHNGERFVPIVELAKIAYPNSGRKFKAHAIFAVDETGLRVHYADNGFHDFSDGKEWYVHNQLQLFQKLHEWHFDLYSLLDNKLATPITNPGTKPKN